MDHVEDTDRIYREFTVMMNREFQASLADLRATLTTLRHNRYHDHPSNTTLDELLARATRSSRRLHQLLENRLLENMHSVAAAASVAVSSDSEEAVIDLSPVLSEALTGQRADGRDRVAPSAALPAEPEGTGRSPVHTDRTPAPASLPVRMAPDAARRLVTNLLDLARAHARDDDEIQLSAARAGDEAVLRLRYPARGTDPNAVRGLLAPLTRPDGAPTRPTGAHLADELGVARYLVRRLVEVHGGHLAAEVTNGEIRIQVSLPMAGQPRLCAHPRWTAPKGTGRSGPRLAKPGSSPEPAGAAGVAPV